MTAALDLERQPVIAAVGWATFAALAPMLGKPNPRAVRDWCKRHRVPYRRDGKHNWVRIEDVQRALARLPAANDIEDEQRERMVDAALDRMIGR